MKITLNFNNILSELERKDLKLCFVKKKYLFIEDNKNNIYQMENNIVGSYLDRLIKDGTVVEFNQLDNSVSQNIYDWEKEIWDISEVKNFIKRQELLMV